MVWPCCKRWRNNTRSQTSCVRAPKPAARRGDPKKNGSGGECVAEARTHPSGPVALSPAKSVEYSVDIKRTDGLPSHDRPGPRCLPAIGFPVMDDLLLSRETYAKRNCAGTRVQPRVCGVPHGGFGAVETTLSETACHVSSNAMDEWLILATVLGYCVQALEGYRGRGGSGGPEGDPRGAACAPAFTLLRGGPAPTGAERIPE